MWRCCLLIHQEAAVQCSATAVQRAQSTVSQQISHTGHALMPVARLSCAELQCKLTHIEQAIAADRWMSITCVYHVLSVIVTCQAVRPRVVQFGCNGGSSLHGFRSNVTRLAIYN